MDNYFNRHSCIELKTFITVVILMALITANAGAAIPSMVFEGYEAEEGAPPPPIGGTIGSHATGDSDPWFGTIAYWYMDGWNHAPRVPEEEYSEIWTAGGHAGQGTAMQGWTSLINDEPGRYVIDFSGYEYTSSVFHEDMGDPLFGHEDRLYHRMTDAGEGRWQILDTTAGTSVASGTVGDVLAMDIFYDPLNVLNPNWDPYVRGTGTIIAENDGGAFYNELITRWGTATLNFTGFTDEPPIQAENPGADPEDAWAIYGTMWTVTPIIPEPATICLLGLGALSLIKRKN